MTPLKIRMEKQMRIDKFLKVSRIIKRRTIAKEIVDSNRIYVNDKIVKPSFQLKVNDIVTIYFGNKKVVIKVLSLPLYANKDDSSSMYELIEESKITNEAFE